MPANSFEGGVFEVLATVTVRVGESVGSARKKDLKPGTMVELLELGAGSGRRARVRAGTVEGWISLETGQGRPFLRGTAARPVPSAPAVPAVPASPAVPSVIGMASAPSAAPRAGAPRGAPMPLKSWEELRRGPQAPEGARAVRGGGGGGTAFTTAAESAEAQVLDKLLELGEDDLVDAGVFGPQEAHEWASLPQDEKRRIVDGMKKELEEEEKPPLREVSLLEMSRGLKAAFYGIGVPEGELSFVPGFNDY